MAQTQLNMQLLLRRDNVFVSTYKLAAGEPGFEISTNTLKIGDGVKTWAELPFANREQIDALIKVVDDKVAALNDTYATDAEVEAIRAALDAAKLDKATYEAYIATHSMTDEAITGAIGAVDAKFASYRTSADQDVIDATLATKEALKVVTDELATYGDIVTHDVAEFATAAQGAKADAAAVKADVDAALEAITKAEDGLIAAAEARVTAKVNALAGEGNTSTVKANADAIATLQGQVAGLNAATTFAGTGTYAEMQALEGVKAGSIFVVVDATEEGKQYNNKEFVFDGAEWIELGDTTAELARISTLEGRADALEALPSHGITAEQIEDWDGEVGAKALAETKLDASTFTEYQTAHADDYTNDAIDGLISGEATRADAKAAELDAALHLVISAEIDADVKALKDTEVAANAAAIENITKEGGLIATAKQEAIDAAKSYADGLDHEDTTYTVAATENALEFTVTPDGKGEAQTITLVAPTVDTGVMQIVAGEDIVVTPAEGTGVVTVAHETFTTGTYQKTPDSSDKTGDIYMMTSVTVDNGHVTGANVQSLAHALEAMSFILDGGTSGAVAE